VTPDTDEQPEVAEESLEDTLRSAFAAANEETPADPDPQAEALAEDTETPSGRERDEHGRFKPKAGDEAPVEAGTALEAPTETPVTPDPYGLAPQYASKVVKDKWASLDPELRKEYHEREGVFHRELTKQDGERNFGRQIKAVVAPFEGLIKSLGAEPLQAIDYLLKGDAALRQGTPEQKRAMFMQMARDYGVQINPGEAPEQQQPVDPRLETMQQRIDRLEREQNDARNAARETEQAEIASSIETFASDPANAYFEQVRNEMSALLQSGLAGSLKEAYDKAVWANPETRALHLAAERATEDRKRTAGAAEQAAKARRASPSVTGAPGSAVQPLSNGSASNSVEDDVRAALMLHAGRA
jgi:hypothetical protein